MNAQVDAMKHGTPPRGDKDVFNEDILLGEKGELANVLVRVKDSMKGEFAPPKEAVVLDALGYFFKPRVVVVQSGQKLVLKNSGLDNVNFHVKARRNKEVNVGIARGHSREASFPLAESGFPVQHDCCPWQIAWIHVLEHPFWAITGADGSFKIKGLPAGTYEIEACHEVFGVLSTKVTVDGKDSKTHDFAFEGK